MSCFRSRDKVQLIVFIDIKRDSSNVMSVKKDLFLVRLSPKCQIERLLLVVIGNSKTKNINKSVLFFSMRINPKIPSMIFHPVGNHAIESAWIQLNQYQPICNSARVWNVCFWLFCLLLAFRLCLFTISVCCRLLPFRSLLAATMWISRCCGTQRTRRMWFMMYTSSLFACICVCMCDVYFYLLSFMQRVCWRFEFF